MFFDQEQDDSEYYGTFSSENFDYNVSFLDVIYDKIYSR